MKDIEIIDIDYTGKDVEYKKEDNVDLAKISTPWIVPEEGPFYSASLRVLRGGLDLIPGTDFEVVSPVADLTHLTGKGVHMYVELKEHILSSGGEVDVIYQKVGNPILSVKKLMQMLEDMVIKGKPVDWETQITGKPDTYYPAWHSHDIQSPDELVGFGGLVELFSRATWDVEQNGPRLVELLEKLQKDMYNRLDYIQKLRWGSIMTHARNYANPHGVVPTDVDLGNVANNATATPVEDADGVRADLYSTPAGFKRVVDSTEPESEEFIFQNELPFGYYGSGIYLPPPITGSFEGLGADSENSAFCLEGNGWAVGLYRAYDGRVKNLYYTYNTRYNNLSPKNDDWIVTYVQYNHPVITAALNDASVPAAKRRGPNYVIGGSSGDVLMLGDQDQGTGWVDPATKWWICAANNTFDPASHSLKEVNMAEVLNSLPNRKGTSPGHMNIAHVGRWVYLFVTNDSFESDDVGNYTEGFSEANWATFMFRFRYDDLLNPALDSIKFVPINVTYQNFYREMKTNKRSFIPQKHVNATTGLVSAFGMKYSTPVSNPYMNRKKCFFIVPNRADPTRARIRLGINTYQQYNDPRTGAPRGFGAYMVADYEWNVETNTLTLNPHFEQPTRDVLWSGSENDLRAYVNPSQNQIDYCIDTGYLGRHWMQFSSQATTWVPGFGAITAASRQTGTMPFYIATWVANFTGDPNKDFEAIHGKIQQLGPGKEPNHLVANLTMKSPFGVSGFPRHYSDLYALTTGVRPNPIELFIGENENQQTAFFYRLTEPGEGLNYTARDQLKSNYVKMPIYGRATNSAFGLVRGLHPYQGFVNRPRRKNSTSRESGTFNWIESGPKFPNPYILDYTWRTGYNSEFEKIKPDNDGSVVINLDLDYTLDTVGNILTAKATKQKNLRIPKSVHHDMIIQAMGAHYADVTEMTCAFIIGGQPGVGGDRIPSFFSISYHLQGSPGNTRTIVGQFWWSVASTDAEGLRTMKVEGGIQYPFRAYNNVQSELKPGSADNTSLLNGHSIGNNGLWTGNSWMGGMTVSMHHVEVLDNDPQGAGTGNMDIVWYPNQVIATPGNANQPRIVWRKRGGTVVEASHLWTAAQAFNEYVNQVFANPDLGMMVGRAAAESGGAMDLSAQWNGTFSDYGVVVDKYLMRGATYVEGNWTVFVNAEIDVTFNGYTMKAKTTNWDLRDSSDDYKNTTFYIYCTALGSAAEYELTKQLKTHNSNAILVAVITTEALGIATIERRQGFTISGFPLTRTRDMGIPVSSGAITEQGSYSFLRKSELYQG